MFKTSLNSEQCIDCKFCDYFVQCPAVNKDCLGCGICIKGCPQGARTLQPVASQSSLTVVVDGTNISVPARITVGQALELAGKKSPEAAHNCCSGGCFNCAVLADGKLVRGCCTPVQDGMEIITDQQEIDRRPPLRLVSFFPNHLHASVSMFTHGCNLSCDFCHNWNITFDSTGRAITPQDAAFAAAQGVNAKDKNTRIGVSGGEPTLNRRWLVSFLRHLKEKLPEARVQVDTNATLLTPDYLAELWDAGMTDISPDLKGLEVDTFMKIAGMHNRELAQKYLDTSWKSVEAIVTHYADKLYATVGVPFHPQFISMEELHEMGKRLASFNKNIDVNLIVYQPAFRVRDLGEVADEEIDKAMDLLNATGIKRVWCQEGEDIPLATDPEELSLIGENF
jgi:pyruvate formate lyase activating enzyme